MTEPPPKSVPLTPSEVPSPRAVERQRRLAEALRQNLVKRRVQRQGRRADEDGDPP